MLKWITDFITKVENHPQNYNRHIKNNVRQIKELLKRKNIEYKPADPQAFDYFCTLHHHREGKWAGKPIQLDEIERYIAACVLGIKYWNKEEQMWCRYFTELDFFISRKYGKDHFVSPLVEWFAGLDNEPSAWVQILAENEKQSKRTYEIIANSINQKPLSDVFIERKTEKFIECKLNAGKIEYLSGRSKGKDGSNPSCAVVNECHEVTNFNQYNALKSGQGARRQPMMICISSAGITPESLYESLYDRNAKMLEKKKLGKNDKVFALMFGIDETDDPADEACWIKANPMMDEGRPTIQFLRQQYESMKDDPVMYSTFIAKHLNRQIGAGVGYYDLVEIKHAMRNVKKEDFANTYAVGGVDLAATTDLCNATAIILKEDGKFLILQAYFIADGCLARNSKQDNEDYSRYTNCNTDNEITSRVVIITPGNYVHKEYVTAWFAMLRDEYDINFLKIGYDPAMSNEWSTDMQNNGFSHEVVKYDKANATEDRNYGILTEVRQGGYTLDEPIRVIKELFRSGLIEYDQNNKLLPYCFYNLKIRIDANNNLSPAKNKSTGHIDGAMGIFDSFVAYMRAKSLAEYTDNIPQCFVI